MRRFAGLALFFFTTLPAFGYWIRDCRTDTVWSGSTQMVVDMNPGTADTIDMLFGFGHRNRYMAVYKDALYFQGRNPQAGAELFRIKQSDGLPAQVADFATGSASSFPHSFAVFKDSLYFAATTPETGEELFRVGETTGLAVETIPGPKGAEISSLTVYNNALYFLRTTDAGTRLWRYDGTTAEQVDLSSGSIDDSNLKASPLVVFKGKLYLVKWSSPSPFYKLWEYNGSSMSLFKTLTTADDVTGRDFNLGVYKGHLYFGVVTKKDDVFYQDELWRSDGATAPVKIFTFPGNASSYSQPTDFIVYKDNLYFSARSSLWRSDGTSVEELGDLPDGPRAMSHFPSANRLFLSAFEGDWTNREPYIFNGLTATRMKNIMPDDAEANAGSFPSFALESNGALYFYAEDETHGRELWRTKSSERVTLKCDIVVAPIWDDWRQWPIDRREVIVATWAIGPNGRRLISRESVTVTPEQEARLTVLELNTERQATPDAFALATVVFDRETGKVLDSGYDLVGTPSGRQRQTLERTAATTVKRNSMREVMAETIQRE